MNTLTGTITQVQSSSFMSIVHIDVWGDAWSAIVLETPASAPYLAAGSRVEVLFKETETALAKGLSGLISLRNRFRARVRTVEEYPLLSTVRLTYKDVPLTAVISTDSAQRLGLGAGDDVEFLVKTNEVSLCPLT